MNITQQRVIKVLDRIKQQVLDDEQEAEMWSESLNDMLENMLSYDYFGTEGQSDPRGDFRNGDWGMDRVEGVD